MDLHSHNKHYNSFLHCWFFAYTLKRYSAWRLWLFDISARSYYKIAEISLFIRAAICRVPHFFWLDTWRHLHRALTRSRTHTLSTRPHPFDHWLTSRKIDQANHSRKIEVQNVNRAACQQSRKSPALFKTTTSVKSSRWKNANSLASVKQTSFSFLSSFTSFPAPLETFSRRPWKSHSSNLISFPFPDPKSKMVSPRIIRLHSVIE